MSAISRAGTLLAIAAAGLLLVGCASSGPQSAGAYRHYATGQPHYTVAPYQVKGVWYYPKVDYHYDETGTASWYGPGFDHRATADGEIYDMNDLSAAHKTLPLPSVVEVTNLQNGRELRLRVNDRGPFVGDRLIDVSRRAAQLLGFEGTGTTSVRVRVLRADSIQVAEAAMLGRYGTVGVAAAPRAARTKIAAAPQRPIQVAAATPPPRPIQVAEVAPPLRPIDQIADVPRPRPRPVEQFTSAPPPRPIGQIENSSPPMRVFPPPPRWPRLAQAKPARRPWPSLIATAEAETLRLPEPATRAAARKRGRIFVQAGAFAVPENARRVRARIAVFATAEIVPATKNGESLYRVRVGPVANEAEARWLLSKIVDHGYPGARLVAR